MKKLLTLILCWLLAFSAVAETTVKVKTSAAIAGGYVTSLNKVDGSFEDGISSWSASVGTIVKTASTEFQGNFKGVWSGTGTGTLDLQWTATASNTFEASVMFRSSVADSDHYICAYVGTTETGCTLIDGSDYTPNTIRTVKVVADSVMSSAFYLRLKHTGSDAFSVEVDNGKIQPWTPEMGQTVEQEWITVYGNSGTSVTVDSTDIPFITTDKSTLNKLGTWTNNTTYTALRDQQVTVVAEAVFGSQATRWLYLASLQQSSVTGVDTPATAARVKDTETRFMKAGDSFTVHVGGTGGTLNNTVYHRINITATAITDNVVQAWQDDRVGETIYSIQSTPPNGFISAQGSVLGKTSGSHQGEAYKALYDYSWTIASATAGEPYLISSAKGASAQSDWDAGKTITIDESGLFTRAFKTGVTNGVGQKQDDAFQGHWHAQASGNGGLAPDGVTAADYGNFPNRVRDPITDGVNGTPRTASETRPINIAKYVYIRYAQSAPTLLALPTSKQNSYTAVVATDNSITSKDSDWISSVTHTDGQYVIVTKNLGITVAPKVSISAIGTVSFFSTSTTILNGVATITILQRTNQGTYAVANTSINIDIVKQSPDYTAPGVFVGNVAKNQVAIVQYRGNGTRTTLSTTPLAMPLTTVKGDSSIVSIASNKFTLQAGEYEIDASATIYMLGGNGVSHNYLYNSTDASIVEYGQTVYVQSSVAAGIVPNRLTTRLSLTSQKTFEFMNYISQEASICIGLGAAAPNDLNGFIKITKLNGQ